MKMGNFEVSTESIKKLVTGASAAAVFTFSAAAAKAVENTEQTGNEQEKSLEQIMSDAGALSFSGKTEVSQLPKIEHDFESDFKSHEDAISLLDQ